MSANDRSELCDILFRIPGKLQQAGRISRDIVFFKIVGYIHHEAVKQILQGILTDLCCVPDFTKLRFLLKRQGGDILSLVRIDSF